jgi:hypothetical protein
LASWFNFLPSLGASAPVFWGFDMMDKEKILETVRGGLLGFVVVVVPVLLGNIVADRVFTFFMGL